MDDTSLSFTQEQLDAIEYNYSGGPLLVSAAAGSGKTMVLVERLICHLEKDETVNIDDFLIITYTRAAAADIRDKIQTKLLERIGSYPGNRNFRRQLFLSKTASIGTIHTYCSEILRENAYKCSLPHDFRILDENESFLIMTEVAEKVITKAYENIKDNKNFVNLLDTVSEGRDDKQLSIVLLDIYRKLQSTPNPAAWIAKGLENLRLDDISDLSETGCGKYVLQKLYETVTYCKEEILNIKEKMSKSPDFESMYADSINDIVNYICTLLTGLDGKAWDEARNNCDFERVKTKFTKILKGFNKSEELIETRNRIIKNLKYCDEELKNSSAEHLKEMVLVNLAISELLQLVLLFSAEYSAEKFRKGVVDFSDLEHFTLSLLTDENSDDKKSSLAHSLSKRYKEILVDEYQDVNEVQELIFNKLLCNDKKLFMVGDVKQSIYRFRLADPTIFLGKLAAFTMFDKNNLNNGKIGTTIHLSNNFRSTPGILDTVNIVFRNIMSTGFGEMDYTKEDELRSPVQTQKQGKKGKQGIQGNCESETTPSVAVEIDVIDMNTLDSDTDEESPAAILLEANYVAEKIYQLKANEVQIPEKKNGITTGTRNIEYSDIVILLRSVKGKATKFASALTARGIRVELPGSDGFFETVEVTTALAMLSVIDNPLQDVPLVTILAGPLYNFTSDELVAIREKSKNVDFYDALVNSADNDTWSDEISVKCRKILDELTELRELKADMPSDRFIWHVYNKTGLLGVVGAMKDGNKRLENLLTLVECARKYEENGYKGLYGFLSYIFDLRDNGKEPASEFGDFENNRGNMPKSNTVRIISIHKSKGLEFPVVFLANAGGKFNFSDNRSNVVFHKDIGIGSMLTEKARRIKYSTLARDTIRSKLKDETLSEELRILYVAMTRAEEKLIITGTHRFLENFKKKVSSLPNGKIHSQVMMSFQNPLEWILAGIRENSDINVKYIPASDIPGTKSFEKVQLTNYPEDAELFEFEDYKFTDYLYPYQNLIDIRSKITVTAKSKQENPDLEAGEPLFLRNSSSEIALSQPPAFIKERAKFTAAELGSLMHTVVQYLDYNTGSDDNSVEHELDRLLYDNFITEEEREVIDTNKIKRFLDSDIVKRIRASNNVRREFRFSILCEIGETIANSSVDKQLLQGVIDCFFEENGEYVVVDFKTDKVTDITIHEKARQYSPQLAEYSGALERIIKGCKIHEKVLYFFDMEGAEEYKLV